MTDTERDTTTTEVIPSVSAELSALLGRAGLFTGKPMPSREVTLGDGRRFLIQGLTHGEKDEIEQRHISFTDDGKVERDNRGKASEYIARGLRNPDGSRMSMGPSGNDHWLALAAKVRDELPPNDTDVLYLAILDCSGLTQAHQDKILKGSGLTPTE